VPAHRCGVDLVEPDAELRDDLQPRQRLEHALVDRLERDDRSVVAVEVRDRLLLAAVIRNALGVHFRVGIALEQTLHQPKVLAERDRGNGYAQR
jgi:hypothetical protein